MSQASFTVPKRFGQTCGHGQQFVVIEFHDEGNFWRIFARNGAENAKGGSHRVAAALNGKLDDIFAVEIVGIFREARAAGVLDALIDRKEIDM